jgi:predicted extracellular nuclease
VRPPTARFSRIALIIPLLALALSIPAVPAPARADSVYQPLPFSQSWTNASLIAADNDWSAVPGIVAYRGEGLIGNVDTGVDPQTVLAPGSGADADVTANQSDPAALAPSGVAEFDGLSDPTIALAGDTVAVAPAPHLLIHVNTTGLTQIRVRYTLRDLDSSDRNSLQSVALQYRLGESGNFTNVPGAFVLDATTGPNTTGSPINVDFLIPELDNQPQVQLRIITTNRAAGDEWVGVDNIEVISSASDPAPFVSATDPASAGTAPADTDITITFSEPVTATADAATILCGGQPVSYTGLPIAAPGAPTIILDPVASLPFGASCTVTLAAAGIADVDGAPNPLSGDFSFSFTVQGETCPAGPSITPISQVQGPGATTTLPGGTPVIVQGVVTAIYPGLSGLYVQEEPADQDDNPLTSEGLFIFTGNSGIPAGVEVGDTVRVTGNPGEFPASGVSSQTQLSTTDVDVVDCATGGPAIAPTDLALPFTALADLERYEGMLVRLPQQLQISEYFNFDRFGEFTLALPRPGEPRLFQATAVVEPGAAAITRTQENLLRRIIIDDGRSAQNPDPAIHPNGEPFTNTATLQNLFRGGDTVTGLEGILAQQFGTYRVQPTDYGAYEAQNPRPTAPEPVGGTLRVAAMNTLNYFLTLDDGVNLICGPNQDQECRGADANQPQELARQRAKLIAAIQLLNPDVLGLIEIENTPGANPAADLAAGLNDALGAGTYAAIDTGVIGSDAIRVGFIYKPAKATPAGDFALLTSAVDPRFLDDKNRPVLAQSFTEVATGEKLTVAVAHLKSKGSDCEDVSDPDTGDGQGNCNRTRTEAARALVDWLATDPTASGDPDFLIVGDLNAYAKEDPIDAVLAGPDDAPGTADDYANLIFRYQGYYAYSYLFDAQLGYLDHALASAALLSQVTGANELHINADEPDILDYDTSFKQAPQDALYEPNAYRSADHDPVLVGLDLGADDPDPDPGPGPVDPGPDPADPKPFKLRAPLVAR